MLTPCSSAFLPARKPFASWSPVPRFFTLHPCELLFRHFLRRLRLIFAVSRYASLCLIIATLVITLTLSPPSSAQSLEPDLGTLSPEELLLDPERLEAGEGGITERWRAIHSFLQTGLQDFERGEAQVSLTRALLQSRGWQAAKSYAQSIDEPVWRARSLLSIAAAQFNTRNGQGFGIANLDEAFSILRSIPPPQLGTSGDQGFRIVGELLGQQGFFQRISGFLRDEGNVRERARLLEGALPYLSSGYIGLVREGQDIFINDLLLRSVQQSQLDDLLRLSDYAIRSGRSKASNRLLFEAYRRSLLLPPGERRNEDLARISAHFLSSGSFRDALRAVRHIENPYLQSGLLAETGRRMLQAKMESAGRPLLSLSHDIARTLSPTEKRSALLRLSIEYALSGNFAEAWDVLQDLEDEDSRARGVLALAFVLSESGDIERALDVLSYIPDANLRARLMIRSARQIAEHLGPQRLTDLLLELVEANDSPQGQPEGFLSPRSVEGLLEAQLDFGNGRRNKILFDSAYERMVSQTQPLFSRLQAELRFLRIDSRRSEQRAQAAQERIEVLLRNMWVYHDEPDYPSIVESAVKFFIAQNDLTRAFTIAESLVKDRQINQQTTYETHDGLLSTIAFQAARRANETLALRAIASIKQRDKKSRALAKVIDIATNIP